MDGELLYESERTRVVRAALTDTVADVIHKRPLGPGSGQRLRHERAILERLAGLPGIPRLVPGSHADAIVLEDCGGRTLSARLAEGPLRVDELIDFAERLTAVIAGMHQRGVVHKDINPSNIVTCADPAGLMLIDFDLASTFAEERPGFTHHQEITGTLRYVAPEQTGRTGWSVDRRADLYALGATLYEAATGVPPFDEADPLRLIHAHLTLVPAPASALNPAVPANLCAVISHLLEKAPSRRYQSAEGLQYDLRVIRERSGSASTVGFRPGERDFPWRLAPPSQLVGREQELGVLRDAVADAVAGRCRGLLVSGAPGVGKTALIDELRPRVAAAGGWFVQGKADQYRQDPGSDVMCQALRGLVRLLLAEPESRLAPLRAQLRARLGPRAGLLAAVLAEVQALLGVAPDTEWRDPYQAQLHLRQAGLDLLRAVATPERPLVIVLDDLQWAGQAPTDFVDGLLNDEELAGVLLIGAYREAEVDSAHPLSALLSRWRRMPNPPVELPLANLHATELGSMIGEILHQPPVEAVALAEAVRDYTKGNPFDTLELLNTLRHEGALFPSDTGWTWEPAALNRPMERGDILALLTDRIGALEPRTRELLATMACLGSEVELTLLEAALGYGRDAPGTAGAGPTGVDLDAALAPALEDGLLVVRHSGEVTVHFRHDRIQQAAYASLAPDERVARHLTLARRLSRAGGYAIVAAEQYLHVVDRLADGTERRTVAALLRAAGHHARLLANHVATERFLAAAAGLLGFPTAGETPGPATDQLVVSVAVDWHAALFALARFDDLDRVYGALERGCADPVRRADAACVQIRSLTNRGRPRDALALGLAVLAALGHPAPDAADLPAEIERGMDALQAWVGSGSAADDVKRGADCDPRLDAVAKVLNRTIPPAFFTGAAVTNWLVAQAARVWADGGPADPLVGPLMRAPFATIAVREDYRTGHAAARRVLAVAEELGYDTAYDRYLHALAAGPWFDPLEATVEQARHAREDLLRAGRVNDASYTFYASVCNLVDCTPTLDDLLAEVRAALALTARAGNDHVSTVIEGYRQAARALRGETRAPGSFDDDSFDEATFLGSLAGDLTPAGHFHTLRALTAAIFDDQAALLRHANAGMALVRTFAATQNATRAHLLRALALAGQRDPTRAVEPSLLADFDRHHAWMRRRAAEAPVNFLHLSILLDAERGWLVDDFAGAAKAFDTAQRETATRQRPWHRALIAEHRARFHLAHGMGYAGRAGLREARSFYQEWGATGKVRQLDERYRFLRAAEDPPEAGLPPAGITARSLMSSDLIDMLGVLRASQALSSETNVVRLQQRIVEVVGALTGATGVRLLLWEANAGRWVLSQGNPDQPGGDAPGGEPMPVEEAGAEQVLPISAFRYVQRTRQPLLVEDATRDARFADDPYLRGVTECSLLVMPIISRGEPSAMLLLENRHGSGAFGADRLDTVQLIAGQLSVSLDNATLYTALERKVAERTEALTAANQQLELLAVTDPLTGLPNRRRLTEVLELQWRHSARSRDPVAVAMVDIDEFKQYNDHYGHPAGDSCLRKVSAAISQAVRDTDLVVRYGGEEFAVVLPNTDHRTCALVGERIRAAVAGLAEPHAYAAHGQVTISLGFAVVVPEPATTPEQLIKLADAELYRAKRAGRNRVSGAPAG